MPNEMSGPRSQMLELIRANTLELNTFLPGTVKAYYPDTQTVDVQPDIMRTLLSPPSVESRPVVFDVPLIYPRSGENYLHIPVKVGDKIGLIFSQRSLDEWSDSGEETYVRSSRMHDLSDAVGIVGLDIANNSVSLPDTEKVSLSSETGLWIGNAGGSGAKTNLGITESELFTALSAFMTILKTTPLTSSMGPVVYDANTQLVFDDFIAVMDEIGGNS